jgi:uncharacterized protein
MFNFSKIYPAKTLLGLALLFLSACASVDARSPQLNPSAQATASPSARIANNPVLIPAKIANVSLQIELARTHEEQQMGLMFRKTMPADQGMLFVFAQEQRLGFWMKNTYLPLSIAFLNAQRQIVDIQDMLPLDETTHVSAKPALYALEMNQGWFDKNGISSGSQLEISLPPEPAAP